ncbi:dienelactone hydrolase family protein [Haloferula sargassicola]|uniref:Dienelactone hydrolase domain-containing protein n=1 Tax=Haloferula sargassicola TaxID=490096 RepID=A0ABP9UTD0_9BACT
MKLLSLALAMTLASHAAELVPAKFETDSPRKLGYSYLISRPDRDAPEKGWPLIIFLHGAGERGTNLNDVKRHGPPKLLAAGRDIPAVVVAPQCPPNQVWDPHAVKALTGKIMAEEKTDPDRTYLTGLSMGGFGTWDTAMEYPDLWAAIAPVCGGTGIRFLLLDKLSKTPCWIFHGEDDPVVSVEFSRQAYEGLKRLNAPVKITTYPGVGHDSWTRAYEDHDFWKWLLAQHR